MAREDSPLTASLVSMGTPKVAERAVPRKRQASSWRGRLWSLLARWLGSLQVAVILLPLFAAVLFLGTLMESWYDRKIAQQLVYQTWWFIALLGLLGVNIFFAAVKKWPWKKHQTGFLITHVGLLTLVAGGVVNSLGGIDAMMVLVDAEDAKASRYGAHSTNWIIDRNVQTIRVQRPGRNRDEVFSAEFEPGPLAWGEDESLQTRVDGLASFLGWLAHPLPRSWAKELDQDIRLEVLGYHPHARQVPFGRASAEASRWFPAVKIQMSAPLPGAQPPVWVACQAGEQTARMGPGLVEFLGRDCRPEQLAEFRHPPKAKEVGPKGQLVLGLGGRTYRLNVARQLDGGTEALGDSGWILHLENYFPSRKDPKGPPINPYLLFTLTQADGRQVWCSTQARTAGEIGMFHNPLLRARGLRQGPVPVELRDLWLWYHPPDDRYGDPSLQAVLQFVSASDGRLHYRSFHTVKDAGFGLEKTGTAARDGKRQPVWGGMSWKFQVQEFLPRALMGPAFVPEERRLGLEDDDTPPAIHCRLTKGTDAKEFWLGKTDGGFTSVFVGSEDFLVGYNSYLRDLDFAITLARAEQTTDRGSAQPASQTSYVLLTDPEKQIQAEPRVITLNQPLEHRGYKLYQGNYLFLGMDETGKPVSRSILIVGRDPGVWLKYAGSIMLACGIACMFYMKAYFFKSRSPSRQAAAQEP